MIGLITIRKVYLIPSTLLGRVLILILFFEIRIRERERERVLRFVLWVRLERTLEVSFVRKFLGERKHITW